MIKQAKTIKAFLWDMDDTLVLYNEAHKLNSDKIVKKIVSDLAKITLDDASALVDQSKKETGYSFILPVQKYNFDSKILFKLYQNELTTDGISPASNDFQNKMKQCDVKHCLVTHSYMDWADRAMKKRGIHHHFAVNDFHTYEKYEDNGKDNSPTAVLIALEAAGIKPHEALMIEDSTRNLKFAHQVGVVTSHVYPKDDTKESFVDYVYADVESFMDDFIRSKYTPL